MELGLKTFFFLQRMTCQGQEIAKNRFICLIIQVGYNHITEPFPLCLVNSTLIDGNVFLFLSSLLSFFPDGIPKAFLK